MQDRQWWTRTVLAASGVAAIATLGAGVAVGTAGSAEDLVPTRAEAAQASTVLAADDGEQREVDPELAAAREKARELEGKERRAAMKKIRDDVAAGTYGEDAEERQAKREKRLDRVRGQLPTALREDLAALRKLPEDERADAKAAIRKKAADGEYGKGTKRLVRALG